MLPPQAPPAHVAHANQAAVDMLQRMQDTQQWLAEQQDAMPERPLDVDARPLFLADLDAFWQAPVEHASGKSRLSRRQAFAQRLAQTARDDAALRHNDGTLADTAAELARGVASQTTEALPAHLHARELLVGSVPYAGALVLFDDRDPGQVLLFTTEAGWQIFPSLEALYSDVEEGWRERLVHRHTLPGVGAEDLNKVIGTHFLDSRPIDGQVFDTLATRIIAHQGERIEDAWARSTENGLRDAALQHAMDLHSLLDVHAIVRHRDLALAAQLDRERLAVHPAKVAQYWRDAAAAYRDSAAQASDTPYPAPLSLEAFTFNALATALSERGIHATPVELNVRVTHRTLENGPIATAFSGFAHEDLSLLELAFRNIGSGTLPTEGLAVIDSDGSPRNDVSTDTLRDIVRHLDIANAYPRHLDRYLGDAPEGREQRQRLTELQRTRMRFENVDARLASYDALDPHSFAWVNAVLDHPAAKGRARIGGNEIVVYQLTYQDTPLAGVFLFAARQVEAVPRVILYTPDAPDNITYREFSNRAELTRNFLLKRSFETYLLDRLPNEFTERDKVGNRHFKLTRLNDNRTLSWVFSLEGCRDCTQLAEHFQEREITKSFLDVAYDTAIAQAKRDASEITRSTTAADWASAADVFWYWNLPVQLAKEVVTGTVQSIPRTAQAAWRFYDHVKAGESIEAFLAFTDGYVNALNTLPLYTQVPRSVGTQVRTNTHLRFLAASQRNLPAPQTLFEKRFVAQDVTVPTGKAPGSGIYTIDGQRYIHHAGKMYQVRYDSDIAGWRLTRPDALDARVTGPAIERVHGQWQHRKVGLLGGIDDRLPSQVLPSELRILASRSDHPALASLSPHQRSILFVKLLDRFSQDDANRVFQAMTQRKLGEPAPLTSTELIAWNEALAAARQAPRFEPGSTSAPPPLDLSQPPANRAGTQGNNATAGTSAVASTGSTLPAIPGLPLPVGNAFPQATVLTRVPTNQWPQYLYAYRRSSHPLLPQPQPLPSFGNFGITLNQRVYGNSVEGIFMTTHNPSSPLTTQTLSSVPPSRLALLPRGATTMGELGTWVRIDIRALMARRGTHEPFHLFSMDGSRNNFILRPVNPANPTLYSQGPVVFYPNEVVSTNLPPPAPPRTP